MTGYPHRPLRGLFVRLDLLADTSLSGLDKLVCAAIEEWDWGSGCMVSRTQLAGITGCSLDTLAAALTRLQKRGRIKFLKSGGYQLSDGPVVREVPPPGKPAVSSVVTNPLPEREHKFVLEFFKLQRSRWPRMVREPTTAQIENSVRTLEQLQRIDGFSWQEVERGVRWGIEDSFWSRNILSPTSLRKVCRNGATKFANIFQQATTPVTRRRGDTIQTWVSPVLTAFNTISPIVPGQEQIHRLETLIDQFWQQLPGEATRPYLVAPGHGQTPQRSIRFLLRQRGKVVEYMAEFVAEEYRNFPQASFGVLMNSGWDKFTGWLERKLGHRLKDGTPLR